MAMPASYKPSPLGYGSPRSSPFRRPESPSSPTGTQRQQTTPTASPTKLGSVSATASRFANSVSTTTAGPPTTTGTEGRSNTSGSGSSTSRGARYSSMDMNSSQPQPSLGSPAPIASSPRPQSAVSPSQPVGGGAAHGNALSQLQPAQVRVLRDGFQILDRDSDGTVNREDVADMLTQLGLPSSQSDVSQFFPPGGTQTMTLAVFLNGIADTLASMSPSAELLSAFSAFDDDDSGQVDLAELRDALLNTAPEPGEKALTPTEVDKITAGFSGRRAFSKSSMMAHGHGHGHGLGLGGGGAAGAGKRGEVFRYQDFVNSIVGGNGASESASHENSEG